MLRYFASRTRHDSSRHAGALHFLWMFPDPG